MTANRAEGFTVLARAAALVALTALVVACGGDGANKGPGPVEDDGPGVPLPPPEDPDVVTPPPEDGEPPSPPPEPCESITLRVGGVDAGDATAYTLELAAVEVLGEEGPVDVTRPRSGPIDLLRLDHAYDLGTVPMPDCPARLRAVIRLAGGQIALPSGEVVLDPLSPPIAFPIDADDVAPGRCHVVVLIDLTGSLGAQRVATAPLVFLPAFNVHY